MKLLGVFLLTPSSIFIIAPILLAAMSSFGARSARVNVQFSVLSALFFGAFVLAIPGVLTGNQEADRFLVRIAMAYLAALCLAIFSSHLSSLNFETFLYFLCVAALINACVVVVTALRPDIFDLLQIRQFSGFDRPARPFRSPGLFRGFDTSGFFIAMAIAAMPASSWFKLHSNFFTIAALLIFVVACLLSSRSSIVVLAVTLLASFILYGRANPLIFRIIFFIMMFPITFLSLAFLAELYGSSFFITASDVFRLLSDEDLDSVYAQRFDQYLEHFQFHLIEFFPVANELTPDNFFARAGFALGWIGVIGVVLLISYMAFFSIKNLRGRYRAFATIFFVIWIISNFKNSYFLFLPFFSISLVIFFFSASVKFQKRLGVI